ncbi:pyridoxal phosphate-dependent aminotransferase [Deinococcus peraridilitoris]|uniref:Histidinol-phosphate aminotransferase n=1 Tax=Deinococcus peraridilitoris (strain DSM 19664 / LMG 22246 / CIP 109416 / KR-200) TaxID=937777 RepID=K9ZXX0_DEIPD|nr:histidinol-phosphate transaminase [Deinococcus peraridilitoris]AFZ66446.1 PLP-dependent enzyme, histidinol-phosphate/aromatic aminotransferase or cobyric acid decarboxylase [Deinococcus peraridilitoris DSM 19664]
MTTSDPILPDSLASVRADVRRTPAYPFTPIDTPVKLDQNESPLDFPEDLKRLALERAVQKPWNRYPDLNADTLREKIAQFEDWDPRGVIVTPGSNVLIKLLTEMSGIGQTVLTVKPTFAVYELEALMLGAKLVEVPLNEDFSLPLQGLERELQGGPGVFYVTEPHAPTGFLDTESDVARLVEAAGERWTTVIDEAYHQYSGSDYRNLARGHENRLIVRTFSKAWGLAGLRLGYALTSPALASELQKLVPAFNINVMTQAAIEVALEYPEYVRERAQATVAERGRMLEALRAHPTWRALPSSTNFFLVRTPDAGAAYQALIDHGVLTRRQDKGYLLEGCLRVSVGLPEENDRFLAAAMQIQAG